MRRSRGAAPLGVRRPLAALLSLGLIAATGGDSVPIREARWIMPNAQLEQLSIRAEPCLGDTAEDILYGVVAFKDPLLLGGQAARAGISCASCHRGGRGNTAFVFPGVSGMPGTADVTSSLFSSHRGDGTSNPVPIPDLTFDPPKVSRSEPGVLENFIRGLIVEEFDGAEPPKRLVVSLANYIRALDPKACEPSQPWQVEHDIATFDAASLAIGDALGDGDRDAAIAMMRGARSALGQIAERFIGSDAALAALKRLDSTLGRRQRDLQNGGDLEAMTLQLGDHWQESLNLGEQLSRLQSQSLYNRDRLAAALSATRTP
jgi:hypothetical protein